MNKNIYKHNLLNALRTGLIFITGIFSYEILKEIENEWNKKQTGYEIHNLTKRKFYHFLIIFIVDFIILSCFYILLNHII